MANIEHANLTGSALHEPKGVENATLGQVYVADGNGSGNWSALSAVNPVGFVGDFAGSVAPTGWLMCFGQAVSRTTYAQLYGVIGTAYGAGDGSTTFNVPDLRGMVTAGKDNMGGSTRGMLTPNGMGVVATTLGNFSGSETHILQRASLPNDTLSVTGTVATTVHGSLGATNMLGHLNSAPTVSIRDGGGVVDGALRSTQVQILAATSTFTGNSLFLNGGVSQTAFSKVQPTFILNKIIYANA
jgi:microcystin-dependent protein